MRDRPKIWLSLMRTVRADFPYFIILGALAVTTGCGSMNPDNTSTRPWDRPTRWDEDHSWMVRPDESHHQPGDNYP
jgi:hypothetical protein